MARKKEGEKTSKMDEFFTAGQTEKWHGSRLESGAHPRMHRLEVDTQAGFLSNLSMDRIHWILGRVKNPSDVFRAVLFNPG